MSNTATEPRNYKQTLNLPKTAFPMRANLAQNEPQSVKRWEKAKLYGTAVEARADGPPFVFHDGPPYANGSIHTGHLLNKVLKDFVVRTRLMAGRHCPYVPGWDCHGLPIEHRVMTELIEKGRIDKLNALPEDQRRVAIRRECRAYAEKHIKIQMSQMQRLLTLADYDDPYLTMNPRYEAAVLEVFARLVARGVVYRALKPVHWSIENQTALAEAELEYYDREDLSVYVLFECVDRPNEHLMIWTTTPWTLPANMLVAVHPDLEYGLYEVGHKQVWLAKELAASVLGKEGIAAGEPLKTATGRALVDAGTRYRHPFMCYPKSVDDCNADVTGAFVWDNSNPESMRNAIRSGAYIEVDGALTVNAKAVESVFQVVEADYVTVEDGTGLVHTAPGHGADDYHTGQRHNLPIYCPVRENGTYDKTLPEWIADVSIWDANAIIVDRLRESGHLFHSHKFTHSYPHDWRGKSPVIFRCTEQWFVDVNKQFGTLSKLPDGRDHWETASLKTRALKATNKDVTFIPEWGRNRMRGMLENRPDWCISRQRAWGLPIPAFQTPDGEVFLTEASVRAVAECFREKGSDAWFTDPPEALLKTYDPSKDPDAPKWVRDHLASPSTQHSAPSTPDSAPSTQHPALQKMHDIFDVWFESGNSWNAVMNQRGLARTDGAWTDLYLEGSDQHRGWFQLSLLPALGATGRSPFAALLTHGFVVDKDGKKMSKSGGNALDVEELLKDFGADVCRWWVSSLSYENDVKADLAFFETAGESYRKVRNTLRFLLSNLGDFTMKQDKVHFEDADATSIDAWALGELIRLSDTVREAYEKYQFRRAHEALFNFCNETMSATYLTAVKDRLYCDATDSRSRRRTQSTIYRIATTLTRLLAPILPHTADEAWSALEGEGASCVHLKNFQDVECMGQIPVAPAWAKVMEQREHWQKAIEDGRQAMDIDNPLGCGLLIKRDDELARFDRTDLADLCGISRFELLDDIDQPTVIDLRDQPRCERSWKRDGTVKQRADGGMLCDRCAAAVGV